MNNRIRSILAAGAAVVGIATLAIGGTALPAGAESPTHVMSVTRNITTTGPLLPDCPSAPGAVALRLVFTETFHLQFTDTSFHLADNEEGTFDVLSATGAVLASGHFTFPFVVQAQFAPVQTVTFIINAAGRATDGTTVHVRVAQHVTVNANGDVSSTFSTVSC